MSRIRSWAVLVAVGLAGGGAGCAHDGGRREPAAERHVVRVEPKGKHELYNLGVAEQSKGRLAAAERRYRAVLALDPEYEPALYNLALVRSDKGDVGEAIELYRRAIAVRPDNEQAMSNLALLLEPEGHSLEARAAAVADTLPDIVDIFSSAAPPG